VAVDVVVVEVVALRLDPLVVDVSSVDMVHAARRGDLNLEEFIMSSNTLSEYGRMRAGSPLLC
jgi:hypothetical protein